MVTKKEIEHLAKLVRIEISEKETEALREDMEHILSYVEKLNQAETGNVEPARNGIELENVMRKDNPNEDEFYNQGGALVDAAPGKKDGYVKVKSVWN